MYYLRSDVVRRKQEKEEGEEKKKDHAGERGESLNIA